jgi:hypothetical protein
VFDRAPEAAGTVTPIFRAALRQPAARGYREKPRRDYNCERDYDVKNNSVILAHVWSPRFGGRIWLRQAGEAHHRLSDMPIHTGVMPPSAALTR